MHFREVAGLGYWARAVFALGTAASFDRASGVCPSHMVLGPQATWDRHPEKPFAGVRRQNKSDHCLCHSEEPLDFMGRSKGKKQVHLRKSLMGHIPFTKVQPRHDALALTPGPVPELDTKKWTKAVKHQATHSPSVTNFREALTPHKKNRRI